MISPHPYRERHLFYGAPGTGKSLAYVDLYDNTESRFFVVDTDVAVQRMFSSRDTSRVQFEEPTNYKEAATAFLRFSKLAKPDDFIVIDLVSPLWQWTQDFWVMQNQGLTEDEMLFWVPERSKSRKGDSFKMEWVDINRLYGQLMKLVMKAGCHVIAIAEETAVVSEGSWSDKAETMVTFGSEGFKPVGNKRNPHLFHTVTHFQKIGEKYLATIVKEREGRNAPEKRQDVTGQGFFSWYITPHWQGEQKASPRPKRRRRSNG